jgi:3-oxoacyl-[acyl-carrier protein] reductase
MSGPGQPSLESQTAVVTGASSGIGRAIALELARAGASVVVHARRSRAEVESVAEEIRSLGAEAEVILADLTDRDDLEALTKRAWDWHSGVDAWINNAGADVLTGEAVSWPFERRLDALWKVDVASTIHLGRLIGRKMKLAGGGTILNTGWDGAERGMAGDGAQLFALAKGAIMAFTRSLAQSLAPEVRVNCVAPGWIKTAWGEDADQRWQQRAVDESLSGRWGLPEDVARAAVFLVSPAAAFINGQIVEVNGGFRRA